LGIGALGVALAVVLAYRDVKISTRLMLGLEIVSVLLITTVAAGVLLRNGVHPDMDQLRVQGITPDKLRLGLVLAIFSLVGFESATSLGHEAKDPLTTIPRAVKWSAILAGLFFVFCAYSEVLAFRGEVESLDKSVAPFTVMARHAGMPAFLSILIDVGGVASFFSCMLACLTASARVLYLMGQRGAIHSLFGEAHDSNRTPHRAVVVSGLAVFLPLIILISMRVSLIDIYGLLATLATFGFLTAYALVCIAAPVFLRANGSLTVRDLVISGLALIAMGMAFMGNVYPVPPAPYSYLSYIYVGLMLAGLTWSLISNARTPTFSDELSGDLDAVVD
jgi:amino acid transporter